MTTTAVLPPCLKAVGNDDNDRNYGSRGGSHDARRQWAFSQGADDDNRAVFVARRKKI